MSKTVKSIIAGIVITVGAAFLVGATSWAHNIDEDNTRQEEKAEVLRRDVDELRKDVSDLTDALGDISEKVNFLAHQAGFKPKGMDPPYRKATP